MEWMLRREGDVWKEECCCCEERMSNKDERGGRAGDGWVTLSSADWNEHVTCPNKVFCSDIIIDIGLQLILYSSLDFQLHRSNQICPISVAIIDALGTIYRQYRNLPKTSGTKRPANLQATRHSIKSPF